MGQEDGLHNGVINLCGYSMAIFPLELHYDKPIFSGLRGPYLVRFMLL